MMKSVLQDWVMELGLRHQGVLLTVVRGCDTAPKDDPSKLITRAVRSLILNAFCGDDKKSATFIEYVDDATLAKRMKDFRKNLDHYPHHYVMHFIHAVEIIGYKHPDGNVRELWKMFYNSFCHSLHMNPETIHQMDTRLGAEESIFASANAQ